MSKKKAIIVKITERAHKPKKGKPAQPWTVRIEYPGNTPADELQERYTRSRSAVIGALRKLGVWDRYAYAYNALPLTQGWRKDGREIKFHIITLKGK